MTNTQTPPDKPAATGAAPSPTRTAAPASSASALGKDTHDRDVLGMGRTAGQRTAEVFAGLRAELMRTPETEALARISGRITARLITTLGGKKILNFIPVRMGSYTELIKKYLDNQGAGKTLVELGTGFSPRGIVLAKLMPDLQIIEIDLPDVIQEKQRRLAKGRIAIPPNLTMKSADLGIEPLSDVLNKQQVDVVTAEGLMSYFDHSDITRIARQVSHSLKPGGVYMADIGYMSPQAMQEASGIVKIFRRYTTSNTPGFVYEEEKAYSLFRNAGYQNVELYRLPQTAELYNLPQPVSDATFIMVARR